MLLRLLQGFCAVDLCLALVSPLMLSWYIAHVVSSSILSYHYIVWTFLSSLLLFRVAQDPTFSDPVRFGSDVDPEILDLARSGLIWIQPDQLLCFVLPYLLKIIIDAMYSWLYVYANVTSVCNSK